MFGKLLKLKLSERLNYFEKKIILLIFSILKSKEHADVIKRIANKWREQHDFDIHDTLVFDGELIDSFRN